MYTTLFSPASLRYNRHMTLSFRCTTCWFDTLLGHKWLPTQPKLAPSTGHIITISFFVVRTYKLYSLNNFQMYYTLLLTLVSMLCRVPKYIHLLNGSLWLSDQHLPIFPTTKVPANLQSALSFNAFGFLKVIPNPCMGDIIQHSLCDTPSSFIHVAAHGRKYLQTKYLVRDWYKEIIEKLPCTINI